MEQALLRVKESLCTQAVVYTPDFTKPFILYMDASNVALSAVLSQPEEVGEYLVAYISEKLQPQEWAYTAIEK